MFSRLGTFFILIFCSSSLFSHEFNPAHLVVNESEENIYEVKWMYPSKNIGSRGEVFFPTNCARESGVPLQQGKYLVEKISLTCDQSLKGLAIEVRNLSVLTDALVTITHLNGEVFEGLLNVKKSSTYGSFKRAGLPFGLLYFGRRSFNERQGPYLVYFRLAVFGIGSF